MADKTYQKVQHQGTTLVPVMDPETQQTSWLSEQDAVARMLQGWEPVAKADMVREMATGGPGTAFAQGIARGATLGLSDVGARLALPRWQTEFADRTRKESPWAAAGGELLGAVPTMFVPGPTVAGLAGKAASRGASMLGGGTVAGMPLTTPVGKLAGVLTSGAVGGVQYGAMAGLSRKALEAKEFTPQAAFDGMLEGAGDGVKFGLAMGGVLGGVGAVASRVRKRIEAPLELMREKHLIEEKYKALNLAKSEQAKDLTDAYNAAGGGMRVSELKGNIKMLEDAVRRRAEETAPGMMAQLDRQSNLLSKLPDDLEKARSILAAKDEEIALLASRGAKARGTGADQARAASVPPGAAGAATEASERVIWGVYPNGQARARSIADKIGMPADEFQKVYDDLVNPDRLFSALNKISKYDSRLQKGEARKSLVAMEEALGLPKGPDKASRTEKVAGAARPQEAPQAATVSAAAEPQAPVPPKILSALQKERDSIAKEVGRLKKAVDDIPFAQRRINDAYAKYEREAGAGSKLAQAREELATLEAQSAAAKEMAAKSIVQEDPRYQELAGLLGKKKVSNTFLERVASRALGYATSYNIQKTLAGSVSGARAGGGLLAGASVEIGQETRRRFLGQLEGSYRKNLEEAAAALQAGAPLGKAEILKAAVGGVAGRGVAAADKVAGVLGPKRNQILNIMAFTQADIDRHVEDLRSAEPGDLELSLREAASSSPEGGVARAIPLIVKRHEFLRNKLPARILSVQDGGELQIPNAMAQRMSAAERASFKKYVMAAYNPQVLLNQVASLRVDRETRETVRALYPEFWNAARAMARQTILQMVGSGASPSRAQRATLEVLLDKDDNSVSDALFFQRLYSPPERQMPPRRMKGTSGGITDQHRTELEQLSAGGSK